MKIYLLFKEMVIFKKRKINIFGYKKVNKYKSDEIVEDNKENLEKHIEEKIDYEEIDIILKNLDYEETNILYF